MRERDKSGISAPGSVCVYALYDCVLTGTDGGQISHWDEPVEQCVYVIRWINGMWENMTLNL